MKQILDQACNHIRNNVQININGVIIKFIAH